MLCLGIESSCDDSSLALVRDGALVAQATASQSSLHALFGGVVPEMASREHARFLGPLCDSLLADAGASPEDVDLVAVARGPGLLGSLLVGVAFAKAFALGTGAGLIGVNHLHAHLFAAALEQDLALPALGLLVSGGHTDICRIEAPDRIILMGRTLDDAAGEAFDKAGKMLGLPYPAGIYIDELAEEGRADAGLFPRPYLNNDSLDFSFSGLKTAMAEHIAARRREGLEAAVPWNAATGLPELPEGEARVRLADLCASYRLAVVDTLAAKVEKALCRPAMGDAVSIILAGGVAANSLLRSRMRALAETRGKHFFAPSRALCTDNGAMIGYLGWRLAELGYRHGLELEAIPRGRRVPDDMTRML
ncbi:tRNA (adenosine(37)-N6)-threonylcarbamoyltransferase complex transferase subunit TsaD [Desulfovibrio sp. OttesenSCG-928-A18]|nr:tRNA (adenosine(37)-N6)-threonylcarbamoyltransferase complex transferase subunit TsaD [Desulfovibrio sp. OttesenSCG-928-A18]